MNKRLLFVIGVLLSAILACGRAQRIAPTEALPATQEEIVEELAPTEDLEIDQAGNILFHDDFQDGVPDGWNITEAWVVQQTGDLYTFEAIGNGGAWVPQGHSWSNYAFEVATRLESGSLLLSFNLSPTGRYMVRLDQTGLYLIKEFPADDYTVLSQTGPIRMEAWRQIDMRSYNGHIQVYVDQTLWVDYTDSSPLTSGTIAVTSQEDSQVAVDDVLVTKAGPLPEGEVQAPPPLGDQPDLEELSPDDGIEVEDLGDDQVEQVEESDQQEEASTGGLPDLVVIEGTFEPDPVIRGEPFVANYIIANQGDGDAGAFTLLWKFHAATGVGVCSWDYDYLGAGETVWGGCTKTTNAEAGQSPSTLTVDFEGEIDESSEDNNELSITFYVGETAEDAGGEAEAALPDLTIVDVSLAADDAIRCQVHNRGQADAPAGVRLTLFLDDQKLGWREFSDPIPAGSSDSQVFAGLQLDFPVSARCVADKSNSIAEINDDNNSMTVELSE